jgi:hypothetical protein
MANIPSLELTDKFIKGLQEYNLTYNDIIKNNWKYCGGDSGRHHNYYKLCYPNDDQPPHENECICGHFIEENCYITDGKEKLVLGNCCIQKFIPKSSRTCETCGKPHKNRKVNKCNNCRIGICNKCNKPCNYKYPTCYSCYMN